jgi:hypothetical protein
MSVQVTYTDARGAAEGPLTSAPTLAVANVNDAPVITSNGGGITAGVSLAENQTSVTTVTSTDVDGGGPTYSIVGGVDAAQFTINGSSGALQFTVAPDFEAPADVGTNNVYVVTIQVDDGAGGMAQQILTITIMDVTEGLPPIPPSVVPQTPTPPSLVPQTPTSPSSGPPANEPSLPSPVPIVVGTPILGPEITAAAAWLADSLSGSVPPPSEALAAPARGSDKTQGPSVPLTRELQGYIEEKVALLVQRTAEEVRNAFNEQNLAETPRRISAAYRNQLKALEENLQEAIDTSEGQRRLTVHITTIGGISLTVGFITWLLHSGSLLASLATTLPAWRHFDPLPVALLGNRDRRKQERNAISAARREDKKFHGLGALLDNDGERPDHRGKAA